MALETLSKVCTALLGEYEILCVDAVTLDESRVTDAESLGSELGLMVPTLGFSPSWFSGAMSPSVEPRTGGAKDVCSVTSGAGIQIK